MASDPGPVMAIVTTLWAVHNIDRMETVSKILTWLTGGKVDIFKEGNTMLGLHNGTWQRSS